jgi:hypothetical protein
MCASKTNAKHLKATGPAMNWKHSDLLKINAMNAALTDFNQCSV